MCLEYAHENIVIDSGYVVLYSLHSLSIVCEASLITLF